MTDRHVVWLVVENTRTGEKTWWEVPENTIVTKKDAVEAVEEIGETLVEHGWAPLERLED